MEIFDVFSMNGIENYPAAGEIFLENVILKVSDKLSQGFIFQGGANAPPLGGAVKYPDWVSGWLLISWLSYSNLNPA